MRQAPSDFPFYAGDPIALCEGQWVFMLASVVLAFVLLLTPQLRVYLPWGAFLPALLFCGVPLAGLAVVAGSRWTALFGRVGARDVAWMVGIAVLNLVVTLLLGLLVTSVTHTSANPVFGTLSTDSAVNRVIHFTVMVPQLLGEELFTILPFLACLWLFHTRLGLPRRTAIVAAWIVSAIPFALVHLPTYGWNLTQCLVIIGGARLVLSLAYLATRNLWVSTGAHVLNDWTLFGASLLLARGAP